MTGKRFARFRAWIASSVARYFFVVEVFGFSSGSINSFLGSNIG
jgi:hypothetical protein